MTHPPAGPPPHHTLDGPDGAPPLVLGPSLGTELSVWDPQLPELAREFRVVRWDLPGHGGSPSVATTTVPALARGVLALADGLGIGRFSYAGISLGGAVGAWLAAHHPERIASLVLICSSARFGTPEAWHERAALVRESGLGPVADTAAGRWFTPDFAASPEATALLGTLRRRIAPAGYAACCDALAGYDLRDDLARITAPTLVVAGRTDPATPPPHARALVDGIPGAGLLELPGAAHLANVERPAAVRAALLGHLAAPPDAPGALRVPAPHPSEGTAP
ncbi:3-oxoadipate enol-lactonase [Streptomyces bugieae]|uniref:3-oxoadipate enol-lactonase n=1 Tax=Streptomyces bugieae TaxID=3098223 RepID=A0ABU7NV91_9ACTN|nr:3-oxoadipate enol-lactonase [Streptomyces sp. DSM 41528]